jgi:uncharacterized protein (TIGR04255 family)
MPVYKKNFLTKVIARIDFLPINSIKTSLSADLSKKITKIFPISEPKKELIGIKYQLSHKEVKKEELGSKAEWHFHSKDRDKNLCIASDFFYIEYIVFDNFKKAKHELFGILEYLFKSYHEIQINRSGLRYINNIEFDDTNLFDWSEYLNDNLLSIFNIPQRKDIIHRALHLLELNYGYMNLRFQYGMFNPDFPAQIRRKIFTLDLDAYLEGPQNENEIKDNFVKFNNEAEKLFEISIKDNLRRIMNENGR